MDIPVVRHDVATQYTTERGFERFVAELDDWWPREYSWSQDTLEAMTVDGREGGLLSELGPHGFRCDWGRIVVWSPPSRIVFLWQISPRREPVPDPSKASEVDLTFTYGSLHLEHRAFERHGEGAAAYAAALGSDQGWPYMLSRF